MGRLVACSLFSVETMTEAMEYCPEEDDLIIATFPKCGTTWTQEIVRLIFAKGVPCTTVEERSRDSPFMDMMGVKAVLERTRPGSIKTHLAANLLKALDRGKYIYVLRNPKDVVVSYFHHQRNIFGHHYRFSEGKFEDYFEIFMNGPSEYGDYFDHLLSWYPYTKNDNVLFINYEELKDDPRGQMGRIAKFMGGEWYDMLMEDGMLDRIIKQSSIGSMQKAFEGFDLPTDNLFDSSEKHRAFLEANKDKVTDDGKLKVNNFFRSGKVGGWRKYFTQEMDERMNERIIERLMPVCPEIVEMWKD